MKEIKRDMGAFLHAYSLIYIRDFAKFMIQ